MSPTWRWAPAKIELTSETGESGLPGNLPEGPVMPPCPVSPGPGSPVPDPPPTSNSPCTILRRHSSLKHFAFVKECSKWLFPGLWFGIYYQFSPLHWLIKKPKTSLYNLVLERLGDKRTIVFRPLIVACKPIRSSDWSIIPHHSCLNESFLFAIAAKTISPCGFGGTAKQ